MSFIKSQFQNLLYPSFLVMFFLLSGCFTRELAIRDELTGFSVSAVSSQLQSVSPTELKFNVTFTMKENGRSVSGESVSGELGSVELSDGSLSSSLSAFLNNTFLSSTSSAVKISGQTNNKFTCPKTDFSGKSSCDFIITDPNNEKIYELVFVVRNKKVMFQVPSRLYPPPTLRQVPVEISEDDSTEILLPTLYVEDGTSVTIDNVSCSTLESVDKINHRCHTGGFSIGEYDIMLSSPNGRTRTIASAIHVRDLSAPVITISSPAANFEAKTQVSLTGVCESGLDLNFSGSGLLNPFSVSCTGGFFEQTVFFSSSEGSKVINISQTDAAGNSGTTSRTFIRDNTPPNLSQTSLSSSYSSSTNSVTYGGACESGRNIEVKLNGVLESSVTCTSSIWSYSVSPQTTDASRNYTFTQKDAAENSSVVSTTWKRDTIAPDLLFQNGTSTYSQITASNTAVFEGQCENGFPVTVSGATVGSVLCSNGAWSFTTPTNTSDGILNYTFTQMDGAGNSKTIIGQWERNTQAPILTLGFPTKFVNQSNNVTFSGTCQEELDIVIERNGVLENTIDCPASTIWSYQVTDQTADNEYVYSFRQTSAIPLSTTVTGVWIRDTLVPEITNLGMVGGTTSQQRYGSFNINATGTGSKVTHFCTKVQDTVAPSLSSSCWRSLSDIGSIPDEEVLLSGIDRLIGIIPGSYTINGWVRDEAGNISSLSANSQTTVTYAPISAPHIQTVLISKSITINGSRSERQIATGQPIYLKWIATGPQIPAGGVSIWITFNDIDWEEITSNLNNGINGTCNLDGPGTLDDSATGCYNFSSPSSQYFRIRVAVRNDLDAVSYGVTLPVNASPIEVLAGNTENGLGGDAKSAIFFSPGGSNTDVANGRMLVTDSGVIYVLDDSRGLLKINPQDGKLIPVISLDANCNFLDIESNIQSSCLRKPFKMTMDFNDDIWIYDSTRIRKIDTKKSPMTIKTVIGGGTDVYGTTPETISLEEPPGLKNTTVAYVGMTFLPDNTLLFSSYHHNVSNTQPLKKLSILNPSGTSITNINITGDKDARRSIDLSKCGFTNSAGYVTNSDTGAIEKIVLTVHSDNTTSGDCPASTSSAYTYAQATLDPVNFSSTGITQIPLYHPGGAVHGNDNKTMLTTSRSGNLYAYSKTTSRLKLYDRDTNSWITVAGTGARGVCRDGELAMSCPLDLDDIFVDKQENIFFLENGAIRVIDSDSKIQTLYGQSFFYGDNGLAANARFSVIGNLQKVPGEDRYGIIDYKNYRLREFTPNGNIDTVIGNGLGSSGADFALDSRTQPYNLNISANDVAYFGYNSSGDIIFNMKDFTNLQQWDRDTFTMSDVITKGPTKYYLADNTINNQGGGWGRILNLGTDGDKVFAIAIDTGTGTNGQAFLTYDLSDSNRMRVLTYKSGTNTTGFCPDGTSLMDCEVPTYVGTPYKHAVPQYDPVEDGWLVLQNNTNAVRLLTQGGTMMSLPLLTENAANFVRVRKSSPLGDYLFYCSTTSGKIRRMDLTNPSDPIDQELPWSISSMSCTGKSLIYDEDRDSLVYVFTQNGSYGVAEYVDPTGVVIP